MEIEFILPFVLTFITLGAYGLGHRIRDYAHVIIPFKDPASLLIMFLLFVPMLIDFWFPEYSMFDSLNVWYLATIVGIITGYALGYATNHINMEYVGVHNILEKRQDIYPIVYYYDKEGRMFVQPQSFWAIIKTMIFRVKYPLYLPINQINRKRIVTFHKILVHCDGEVIDLAGHSVTITTVKKGPFKFKVENHKYTPSPNCTDSPYDWIVRAIEYENIFTDYAELQVQTMESKAELQMASVKGGSMVLTALSSKTPSEIFMDEMGIELEKSLSDKARIRNEIRNGTDSAKEEQPAKKKSKFNKKGDEKNASE